jgi:hypothetical protein
MPFGFPSETAFGFAGILTRSLCRRKRHGAMAKRIVWTDQAKADVRAIEQTRFSRRWRDTSKPAKEIPNSFAIWSLP